jgi:hypothetical protein
MARTCSRSEYRKNNGVSSYRDIAIDEYRRVFSYNPETGEIARLNGQFKGTIKSIKGGYFRTDVKGCNVQVHHIAWMLHHDLLPDPTKVIDHIDGNKLNNAIDNLREITQRENLNNNKKFRETGIPSGCEQLKSGKWICRIAINGVIVTLQKRSTLEEVLADKNLVMAKIQN